MTHVRGRSQPSAEREEKRSFGVGLMRGFAAAIIFSTPMLMTMEFWWLGFYASRLRLALFVLFIVPVLIALGVPASIGAAAGRLLL